MARLKRSLDELRIRMPMSLAALGIVLREVVARNRIGYGIVYLQITRGVARRDHAFPAPEVAPSLVVTARALSRTRNEALAAKGIAVVSVPDNRWARVDIKTIGLLPNVLARQAAIEQGARDAWFVDKDGAVTEGASTNAWIVTQAGTVVTRPAADHAILRGITRMVLFDAIKAQGLALEERAFTLEEAYAAREAFVTAASQIVLPVVRDRRPTDRRRQARPDRHRPAAGISPLRRGGMSSDMRAPAIWRSHACSTRGGGHSPAQMFLKPGLASLAAVASNNQLGSAARVGGPKKGRGMGSCAAKPIERQCGFNGFAGSTRAAKELRRNSRKDPRAEARGTRTEQRPWQPTARKICKTHSSITSARTRYRSPSSW